MPKAQLNRSANKTIKGQFLDLLVNWSVSKPSVNCNSLVKFVCVSEQNLNWPLAYWMVNRSCLAYGANHFRLAQAGVMNINECKRMSASPQASQPIADGHFVHSWMDFVVKFVEANVSSSILKTLL